MIDAVKPKRTKFTIEMMGWSVPDGPDSYLKLIKAVDRPAFGVHMDAATASTVRRVSTATAFIGECFRTLGPWIASCHAKDLEWKAELNVHFVEVIPGRGSRGLRGVFEGTDETAGGRAADAGAPEDGGGI